MAVAVAVVARDATAKKRVIAELTFSGTYTTGGEAPTGGFLPELGLDTMDLAIFEQPQFAALLTYDYAENKVVLWEIADAAEQDNGDAIVFVVRGEFIGNSR